MPRHSVVETVAHAVVAVSLLASACSDQPLPVRYEWIITGTGSDSVTVDALLVDRQAGLYLLGYSQGDAINFGTATLTGPGAFLARFERNGTVRYVARLEHRATAAVLHPAGSLLTTAGHWDMVNGSAPLLIVQYEVAPQGINRRWTRAIDFPRTGWAKAITADSTDNLYVAGDFTDKVNFGGDVFDGGSSGAGFVASYDSQGKHRWSLQPGGTAVDSADGVVVDRNDNVYVAGTMFGTADFGGGTLGTESDERTFVVAYSANGVHRWSVDLGSGTSLAMQRRLTIEQSGDLTVVSNPAFSLDGIPMASWRPEDALTIHRLSTDGEPKWGVTAIDSNNDLATGLASDGNGNTYVTGLLNDRLEISGVSRTANREYDMFIAAIAAPGSCQWITGVDGDYLTLRPLGAVTADGAVFVTGTFEGTMHLPQQTVLSASRDKYDVFLMKMQPAR